MAIQINDPFARGGGGQAGQQFGSLLSSGLQQLAQHKMSQISQRNQARSFEKLGVPQDMAQALSMLSPNQQDLVLKSHGENFGFMGQQQQQPDMQQLMQQPMSPQNQNIQQQPDLGALMQSLQMMPQSPLDQLARTSLGSQAPNQEQRGLRGLQQPLQEQPKIETTKSPEVQVKPTMTIQQRKIAATEQKNIDKETKPAYDKIVAQKEISDAAKKRLNKMEQLIDKGNLPTAALHRLFSSMSETHSLSGVPLVGGLANGIVQLIGGLGDSLQRSVTSPDLEEFEKLSADFIRDAKGIFGGRITDADLSAFLKMIPTLKQTDAGKKAIIRNMKIFNETSDVKYNVMKDILRENNGKRPANIEILIEERAKPQLDKLSEKFMGKEDFEKMPSVKKALAGNGIASNRYQFNSGGL